MKRNRSRAIGALTAAVAVLLLLLTPAAPAQADLSFCPLGSGPGQCNEPQGLATDFQDDRLYVADRGNHRVNVFKASTTEFLFSFGSQGTGAGQLSSPTEIAVDNTVGSPARHDVYVISNGRVNRFKADGSFVHAFGWKVDAGVPEEKLQLCTAESGCLAASLGPNECQLSRNSSPVAVAAGDVFVADTSGNEPNFTARVQEYTPAGACVKETTLQSGNFRLTALAVDEAKDAYISAERAGLELRKYDLGTAETKLCDLDPGIETNGIGLDEAGHLFAMQREDRDKAGGNHLVITEYDVSSCPPSKHVRRFGYGKIDGNLEGLAAFPSGQGDVFGSEGTFGLNIVRYLQTPPPGPLLARVEPPLAVGNVRALVRAEVNPEGKDSDVKIEYVDDASFQQSGFTDAVVVEEPVPMDAGSFRANAVEVLLGCAVASQAAIENGECLTPSTEYHWRVDASNADGGGEGPALGQGFTTLDPVEMEVFATAVSSDTATINARVNPLGIAATGFFEYVDQESFEGSGFADAVKVPNVDAEAPEAEYDFGAGEGPVKRAATLFPLEPHTTYHYRLSAQNLFFAGLLSEERIFTTLATQQAGACPNEAFRTAASALLPDCRAYELVSPLDKNNGDIGVLMEATTVRPAVLEQSAASGERLAYGSYRSFGDAESASYTSQYIAARGAEGWESHGINPPQGQPLKDGIEELDSEFRAFSEDLCEGWIVPFFEPPLAAGAIPAYKNLYRRTDRLCGEDSYEAISPAKPEDVAPTSYGVEPQGISADGVTTAFAANDSLEGSGAPAGAGQMIQLYVKGPGAGPRFACILPDGAPSANACSAGTGDVSRFPRTRSANVTNALSADGSSLYWSDANEEGRIYLRRNPLAPESARLLGESVAGGDMIGPAFGSGNLAKSFEVKNVQQASGAFAVGQEISTPEGPAGGIPAGTTITAIEETKPGTFTLTLSAKTTLIKGGAELVGIASATITGAEAESGSFAVGQEVVAANGGIPEETTITALEETAPGVFSLTLSAAATVSEAGAALRTTSECSEADKACTVAVSRQAEKARGTTKSQFWAAAADGSAAIFSSGNLVTGDAGLYRYTAGDEATEEIADEVFGFMGAGEDAGRVYFVSGEAIAGAGENSEGAEALAGARNLYLYEAGTGSHRFVARLTAADAALFPAGDGRSSATARQPIARSSRVSASGLAAAFMSAAPLTGYDNTDAASEVPCGQPEGICDTEVFLYDAGANAGAGELLCASCNPSGARPTGTDVNSHEPLLPFWVAARLTVWETTLYAPRMLSEDGGRLFFESQDALLARDTNGRLDVYQWERAGRGGCGEGASGFSAEAGGCIDLISSGQSIRESRFVDASPSGDDVFFATLASLVSEDYGLLDIYDARVGGGLPSSSPPLPPECEAEDCQSPPQAPEFQTPATATYEGPGNLSEAQPRRRGCPKGKRRVLKGGKARCAKKRGAKKSRTGRGRSQGRVSR